MLKIEDSNYNMNIIRKVSKRITDKDYRWMSNASHGLYNNMSDEEYIRKKFKILLGYDLDLENPRTFNEKNNWRKLYDRKPIYIQMVDKYAIKELIRERIGAEHSFNLIDVWDSPKDISIDNLPQQFVLKANHAGGIIVCRDKNFFDLNRAKSELEKLYNYDMFKKDREWPYKNVQRKIICEEYMGENLIDFKNYCFNGRMLYSFVWKNESKEDGRKPKAYFCGAYNRDWNKTNISILYPKKNETIEKPQAYDEMIEICERISKGIPFVRVDCYVINNRVYIGEMTFFPWAGFQKFADIKYDYELGELEDLSQCNKL